MILIALLAVMAAGLKAPSAFLFGVLLTLTLQVLLYAAYRAGRSGPTRSFWGSLSLMAAAYLVATLAPWFEHHVRDRLPTANLLSWTAQLIRPPLFPVIEGKNSDGRPVYVINLGSALPFPTLEGVSREMSGGYTRAVGIRDPHLYPSTVETAVENWVDYTRTFHTVVALLIGLTGGSLDLLIAWLFRSAARRTANPLPEREREKESRREKRSGFVSPDKAYRSSDPG